MKRFRYLSSSARLVVRNKLLTLTLGVILLLQALSYGTIREFNATHRTIVQPAVVDHPYWIEGGSASQGYLEMMGKYTTDLLLTYHPDSVERQYRTLLTLHTAASYAELQDAYRSAAARIKQLGFSSVYYQTHYDLTPETITIEGVRTRYSVTGKTSRRETYAIDYVISNGKFELINISEVEK